MPINKMKRLKEEAQSILLRGIFVCFRVYILTTNIKRI